MSKLQFAANGEYLLALDNDPKRCLWNLAEILSDLETESLGWLTTDVIQVPLPLSCENRLALEWVMRVVV